jgi:phage-related protein
MNKKLGFVSKAAEKEYKKLPENVQYIFDKNLTLIQQDKFPVLAIRHLNSLGQGVIELIQNGSPAFRCVYVTKYLGTVFVLHSFVKTTNSTDRQAMKVIEQRLKKLLNEIRKLEK